MNFIGFILRKFKILEFFILVPQLLTFDEVVLVIDVWACGT